MKTCVLSAALFFTISFSASSQLLLNSGETYTYRFAQLPFIGIFGASGCASFTQIHLGMAPSTFNEGDSLQIQLYDNSGDLFGSSTFSSPTQTAEAVFDQGSSLWVPGAGYAGEVRVTMMSGSATLEMLALNLQFTTMCGDPIEPPLAYRYGIIVAVPEPNATFLSVGCLVGAIGWRFMCRRGRAS